MDVREKLEVIAHLGDHITYKEEYGICYDSALAKVIEDAHMELKNGVTVQEWISVKDRLPEMHEAVLVYTLTHDVLKAHFRGERSFFGHDGIWRSVTHWMPMPEPPSESTVTVEDECNDEDWGA